MWFHVVSVALAVNLKGVLKQSFLTSYGAADMKSGAAAITKTIFPNLCVGQAFAVEQRARNGDDYPFTPKCPGMETGSNSLLCFPSSATVRDMRDGTRKPVSAIRVGDEIDDGDGRPTRVLGWLHHDPAFTSATEWIELSLEDGGEVVASQDHLAYVLEPNGTQSQLPMKAVQPRVHALWNASKNAWIQVTAVRTGGHEGLFAPLTASGTLSVNGFKMSVFTTVGSKGGRVLSRLVLGGEVHSVGGGLLVRLAARLPRSWLAALERSTGVAA